VSGCVLTRWPVLTWAFGHERVELGAPECCQSGSAHACMACVSLLPLKQSSTHLPGWSSPPPHHAPPSLCAEVMGFSGAPEIINGRLASEWLGLGGVGTARRVCVGVRWMCATLAETLASGSQQLQVGEPCRCTCLVLAAALAYHHKPVLLRFWLSSAAPVFKACA